MRPSPSSEASCVLISAEICAADTPISAGPIAQQHAAHALVAPVEARARQHADARERRDLEGELRDAADEHAPRERLDRRVEIAGEEDRRADDRQVEQHRRERRHREAAVDVQHAAGERHQRHEQDVRKDDADQVRGQLDLARASARSRSRARRRAPARPARRAPSRRAAPARAALPTRPTRSRVASSPRCRWYSARIGTKACENAPSANIRRRMLGRRNAAWNASICRPAPNSVACRLSRTRPVMRDSSVMPLTVDKALSRFTEDGGLEGAGGGRIASLARQAGNPVIMSGFSRIPQIFKSTRQDKQLHGQFGPSKEARPAGGSDAHAQREPQVGAAHRGQEGEEGHRHRRQGRRHQDDAGIAGGDRQASPTRRSCTRTWSRAPSRACPRRSRRWPDSSRLGTLMQHGAFGRPLALCALPLTPVRAVCRGRRPGNPACFRRRD